MASSSRILTRLAGLHAPQQQRAGAQAVATIAHFATTSSARKAALSSTILRARPTISKQFSRSYADSPSASLSPPVKKKPRRIRTTARWLWRFTYLSILTSVGYVFYDGYVARNPDDQTDPDPSKKTLVVLGK